jgi:hypothetical protein
MDHSSLNILTASLYDWNQSTSLYLSIFSSSSLEFNPFWIFQYSSLKNFFVICFLQEIGKSKLIYKRVTINDNISKYNGGVKELHVYLPTILSHEKFSFISQKYF